MTALTDIVTGLDIRAETTDDLNFHIQFAEFNDATGDLTFTEKESRLPVSELAALAATRYDELRDATVEANDWTAGIHD